MNDSQLVDELCYIARVGSTSKPCCEIIDEASHRLESLTKARPLAEWHEDMGPVLWWKFPIEEPPYCGSPLDTDWINDYHTHWTLVAVPEEPT